MSEEISDVFPLSLSFFLTAVSKTETERSHRSRFPRVGVFLWWMHTRACPRGLNESTGRAYRAIEYTAHQARVGPSRLLTRVEGNETVRKHFADNTDLRADLSRRNRRVALAPVLAASLFSLYVQYKRVARRISIPKSVRDLPSLPLSRRIFFPF